jgi:hypothetical protein
MKAEVRRILDAAGYTDALIYLGPDLRDYPNEYVLLTPYGGPGLELDGVLDARSWQVRAVGSQMDDDDDSTAEGMADAIDIAFVSHYSRSVEGVWVASIQRVGGAPSSLNTNDDANRAHFVCSYTVSVELALPN